MKAWLPTVVTALLGLIGAFTPQINDAVAAHPAVGMALGAVYAIVKGLIPSPLSKQP